MLAEGNSAAGRGDLAGPGDTLCLAGSVPSVAGRAGADVPDYGVVLLKVRDPAVKDRARRNSQSVGSTKLDCRAARAVHRPCDHDDIMRRVAGIDADSALDVMLWTASP